MTADLCLKVPDGKAGENSSSLFETLVSRGKGFSSEAAGLFSETDTFTSVAGAFSCGAVGTAVGSVANAGNLLRNHP